MKLIHGNLNYSSWSIRPWLVLTHFALPFEAEQAPLSGKGWRENIRARSPTGKVPVLVDGDLVIPETIAIVEYLAGPIPTPASGRPTARRGRSPAAAAEMHAGFTQLRNAAPVNLRSDLPGRVKADDVAGDLSRIETLWAVISTATAARSRRLQRRRCHVRCWRAACGPILCHFRHRRRLCRGDLRAARLPGAAAQAEAEPWIVERDEIHPSFRQADQRRLVTMIHMIALRRRLDAGRARTYRNERAHWWGADYGEDVHVHRTRTRPAPRRWKGSPRSTG